jgi:hypothetical protein
MHFRKSKRRNPFRDPALAIRFFEGLFRRTDDDGAISESAPVPLACARILFAFPLLRTLSKLPCRCLNARCQASRLLQLFFLRLEDRSSVTKKDSTDNVDCSAPFPDHILWKCCPLLWI